MNKALQKLKSKVQKTELYKLSSDERLKMFDASLEKFDLSKEDYEKMKEELDKIRGRM